MDINENLQQINTFTGGMDTDTSDMLIQSDKFRFSENLRLITDANSNSGELHLIEGSDLYSYTLEVSSENPSSTPTLDSLVILKTDSIRDYGIIIAKDAVNPSIQNQTIKWYILRLHNGTLKYIFGPCGDMIGDNISTVLRCEADGIIKLYIADGVHSLMSINIATDNSDSVPTNISYLTTVKQRSLHKIQDVTLGTSGTFVPGMVQYAYVLYNKYGEQSDLSPLSDMYSISKDAYTGESNTKTVKFSAQLKIPETTGSYYEKIKVYRIHYQQIGQDPIISLIVDSDLQAPTILPVENYFTYNDIGTDIIKLSVDEFLAIENFYVYPNEIESKNDYLFAGNCKDYLKANADAYQYLRNSVENGNLTLNTNAQLKNLSFNDPYNDSWGSLYINGPQWTGQYGESSSSNLIEWKAQAVSSGQLYMPDEIYRFGLVLYDKNGVKWPVLWIGDLRTPPTGTYTYKFRLKNFNRTWGGFFPNFEIVRCNRTWSDRHILSKGIAGRALQQYNYNWADDFQDGYDGNKENDRNHPTDFLTSSGFMTFTEIVAYTCMGFTNGTSHYENYKEFAASSPNYLIFASPEACYQQDDLLNAMKQYSNSIKIQTRQYRDSSPTNKYYGAMYHYGTDGIGFFSRRIYANDVGGNNYLRVGIDYSTAYPQNEGYYHKSNSSRCAMWFPIFRFKYLVPQYRDTSLTRDTRSKTEDENNSSVYEILNDINAQDVVQNVNSNRYFSGNIQDFEKITVPQYDQFMQGGTPAYKNNSTIIDDRELLAWSVPGYATNGVEADVKDSYSTRKGDSDENWTYSYNYARINSINFPVSAIGAGIVLKTDLNISPEEIDDSSHSVDYEISLQSFNNDYFWSGNTQIDDPLESDFRFNFFPGQELNSTKQFNVPVGYAAVPIVDIVNTAVVPYQGFSSYARNHSTYQSFGAYCSTTDENGVIVPGDCFNTTFEYNSAKTWYHNDVRYAPHMTTVYKVPLISTINMNLDHGDKFSRVEDWRIQDQPASLRGYIQDKPAYAYNTIYSNQNSAKFFVGDGYDEDIISCDTRIYNSERKDNGESEDKWLRFKSSSFIDVDSRYGVLTNLKLFKDNLVFNQERASGILSVNERTVIQDVNGENLLLGNGPILQRYDYISTVYGIHKGDHACEHSDTTLYWWDRDNKELLMYNNNGFAPMKSVKNVRKYIDAQDITQTKPVIVYDNKYSEMLFGIGNGKLLSYNELAQQFISQYDQSVENVIYLPSAIIMPHSGNLYEWNKRSNTPTLTPKITYVVNKTSTYNKVFDNIQFGGRLYGGETSALNVLDFTFKTPLKQEGRANGSSITNLEYDFRMSVPRQGHEVTQDQTTTWVADEAGGRLRGKTMECTIESSSTSDDFSLQYIITKFRMSWT